MSSASDAPPIPGSRRKRGSLNSPVEEYNAAEYLSWRRLHLSKSKLDNVSEMSSFMAGFAVVATIELQINDDDIRPPLLIAFVITTALLVGTCMAAIVIATCILPHLESVARTAKISEANQSPHDKMMKLIDISWVLTNSASLFFFTLDIILMCWIKYTIFSIGASIAATVIMTPVLFIIIIFAVLFYRRIVKHQFVISNMKYEELEKMYQQDLEKAASLSNMSYQGTITSNYQGTPLSPSSNRYWTQQEQLSEEDLDDISQSPAPDLTQDGQFYCDPPNGSEYGHGRRLRLSGPPVPDPPSPTLPHTPKATRSFPSSTINV